MYSASITRNNPTAFIFLIDHSGSMEEKTMYGSLLTTKAEAVARVTNKLIGELIYRCRREDGIMDYFDIAAIGYSSDKADFLLPGKGGFAKPSALAATNCRKQSFTFERPLPTGGTALATEEIKYWIEPKAHGNTPMFTALDKARNLTEQWCGKPQNKLSYPPTIFNITDGEASDGNRECLVSTANAIKELGTEDGKVLMININISDSLNGKEIIFPSSKAELPPVKYSEMLFDMSSVMPEEYSDAIMDIKGQKAQPPFVGMSFNTSIPDLIAMMNIGSRSINRMQ